VKFETVYTGWGTPTILTASQLDRFYKILKNNFDLSEVKQIMIEWSPYTTTEDKIKVLSKHWINKITFWVQSLDKKTLKTNNRLQTFELVKNAVNLCKKYKIENINLDIMCWLEWQDLESYKETVKKVQTLNPTTIQTNYFLPTKNTNFDKIGNSYNIDLIKLRNKMFDYGRFLWDLDWKTKKENKNLQQINYFTWNTSILWLWQYAISHIYWKLHYTKDLSLKDYENFVTKWEIKIHWYNITENDELISFLINNLRNWVSIKNINKKFSIDFKNHILYKKINELIKSNILILYNDNNNIKFLKNSRLISSIYSKALYDSEVLKTFLIYFSKNKNEFNNLELRLKQFFID
jgi:coproporphyrinogen III oxidase-like Fe-S oxidoreductase